MNSSPTKIIYLLDTASDSERRALLQWIKEQSCSRPMQTILIPSSRRRTRRKPTARLEAALSLPDDTELVPLRIAWLPAEHNGLRRASFFDLLTFTDPRDPGPIRRAFVRRFYPERCKVVVAASAKISQMRDRWQTATFGSRELSGFSDFVVRQAHLALERAERSLRGARYKVPRFLHEEIIARPDFQSGLIKISEETQASEKTINRQAKRYLREIAASHSPFIIDLMQRLIGIIYRLGYSKIHYCADQLNLIYTSAQRHPVVFLPSHKSNLDHLLLQYLLHNHNFPPNHTAGGINMNFFPAGMLVRRAGVFFIRRSFKDNLAYKFVLRQYIDYLVEKRFPLEWYIEGGRSRTGKLLPPRFGILTYIVDAHMRGKSEDVILVPVSIAYDQISDVGSYVAEQRGAQKEPENFGWMMRTLRTMRRRYGSIYIRFGETISLANYLPKEEMPEDRNRSIQKLAFEISFRVNSVTPITPTAMICLVLLGENDRAMTITELKEALNEILDYVNTRGLPTTEDQSLEQPEALERLLNSLIDTAILIRYSEGRESLYGIAPGQHLAAAYYRNSIVHFFVSGAIAELSLLAVPDGTSDALQIFWDEAYRLRDLLKFEFFFADKETFRRDLYREVYRQIPNWEYFLRSDSRQATIILRHIKPFMAHRVLRPFLESYMVVADALTLLGDAPFEGSLFMNSALALGRQYLLQRRLQRAESVSKSIFNSALNLAAHRGLTSSGSTCGDLRRIFADEIRTILRRIDAVDALQASRRTGVL